MQSHQAICWEWMNPPIRHQPLPPIIYIHLCGTGAEVILIMSAWLDRFVIYISEIVLFALRHLFVLDELFVYFLFLLSSSSFVICCATSIALLSVRGDASLMLSRRFLCFIPSSKGFDGFSSLSSKVKSRRCCTLSNPMRQTVTCECRLYTCDLIDLDRKYSVAPVMYIPENNLTQPLFSTFRLDCLN